MSFFKKLMCMVLLSVSFIAPVQVSFMSAVAPWAWVSLSLSDLSALKNHKGKVLAASVAAGIAGYLIEQNTYKSVSAFYVRGPLDLPFQKSFIDPKFRWQYMHHSELEFQDVLLMRQKQLSKDLYSLQHNMRVAKRWNNQAYLKLFESEYEKRFVWLTAVETALKKCSDNT